MTRYTKYSNQFTELDGFKFDSKKEANRYSELKLLERAKIIKYLKLQPVFVIQPGYIYQNKKIREITYIADFQYFDNKLNKWVVEDCKGFKTEVYRLKKKMFLYTMNDYVFLET